MTEAGRVTVGARRGVLAQWSNHAYFFYVQRAGNRSSCWEYPQVFHMTHMTGRFGMPRRSIPLLGYENAPWEQLVVSLTITAQLLLLLLLVPRATSSRRSDDPVIVVLHLRVTRRNFPSKSHHEIHDILA